MSDVAKTLGVCLGIVVLLAFVLRSCSHEKYTPSESKRIESVHKEDDETRQAINRAENCGIPLTTRVDISDEVELAAERAWNEGMKTFPDPPLPFVYDSGPDSSGLGYIPPEQDRLWHLRVEERQDKRAKVVERLKEKYKAEVAKKYCVTVQLLEDINLEAAVKQWPVPEGDGYQLPPGIK